MTPAEVLAAIDTLPLLDREKVHRAVIGQASTVLLFAELREFSPLNDEWLELVELATEIVAMDHEMAELGTYELMAELGTAP